MAAASSQGLSQSYLDESIGYKLVGVASAYLVLETLCFVGRTFARFMQKGKWKWEDFHMLLAFIFNIALCIASLIVVQYGGVGRHIEAVDPSLFPAFFKTLYIAIPVIYCVAVAFPKFAILDIYLNIFTDRWSRTACWICYAIVALNAIVNIPTVIWQCSPVSYLWDKTIPGGWCNNIPEHYFLASIPNIVTDVIMLILPLPMIWKLHTSTRIKWGLFATFLAGSVGLVTSIIRFVEFDRSYTDATWIAVLITIWTIIEPGMYFVAACFLTYRPLIRYIVYESPMSSLWSKSLVSRGEHSSQNKSAPTRNHTALHSSPRKSLETAVSDEINLVDGQKGTIETFPANRIKIDQEIEMTSRAV